MVECKKIIYQLDIYHIECCLPGGWTANMSYVDGVDDGVGCVCGKDIINVGMVGQSDICEINDLFY